MSSTIKLHDKYFVPCIAEDKINAAIDAISTQLNEELFDKNPLFLGVLNGAFMFASEILKKFKFDCEISFVKLASYQGTQTTYQVEELIGLSQEVSGRTVVILEDIVDTGTTIEALSKILKPGTYFYRRCV